MMLGIEFLRGIIDIKYQLTVLDRFTRLRVFGRMIHDRLGWALRFRLNFIRACA